MTATVHTIPARPASRHLDAARQTLADEGASVQARLNAADMLTIFGDDADVIDAQAFRAELLAEQRQEAPFAWADDNRAPQMLARVLAAMLIVGAVAVTITIATKAMGNVAATMLDVQQGRIE